MASYDLSLEQLVAAYDARFELTALGAAARSDKLLLMSVDEGLCDRVWRVAGTGEEAHPLQEGAEPTFLQLKYLAYAIGTTGPPEEAKGTAGSQNSGMDRIKPRRGLHSASFFKTPTARPAPSPEATQATPPPSYSRDERTIGRKQIDAGSVQPRGASTE